MAEFLIPAGNIKQIKQQLSSYAPHLERDGISGFDILTMFNPRNVISIADLDENYRSSALLLYALDSLGAQVDDVEEDLLREGYMILGEAVNPYSPHLRSFAYSYNPIILAKRVPSLLQS